MDSIRQYAPPVPWDKVLPTYHDDHGQILVRSVSSGQFKGHKPTIGPSHHSLQAKVGEISRDYLY
jgi:hypothetical protein